MGVCMAGGRGPHTRVKTDKHANQVGLENVRQRLEVGILRRRGIFAGRTSLFCGRLRGRAVGAGGETWGGPGSLQCTSGGAGLRRSRLPRTGGLTVGVVELLEAAAEGGGRSGDVSSLVLSLIHI